MAIFTVVGCDDNKFLEEDPETFYTIDNVFTTSEQVDQVLTTCYIKVHNIYCPYNNFGELNLWSYGMGNGTDVLDVPTIRYSYRFNDYSIINSEYGVFKDTYAAFYYLINAANTAIYATNLEHIMWNSESDKAYIIAQARFFRAFAYRNLGELFGGVPLVTEITSTPKYDYKRSTRMETYQYAIDEMEDIINDLPVTTAEAGRLVRAAVQHNLCQLYIDKGVLLEAEGGDAASAYNKAISYANDVIDSGTYSLMTERFGARKNEGPEFYYATSAVEQTADRSSPVVDQRLHTVLFSKISDSNIKNLRLLIPFKYEIHSSKERGIQHFTKSFSQMDLLLVGVDLVKKCLLVIEIFVTILVHLRIVLPVILMHSFDILLSFQNGLADMGDPGF